MNVSPSLVIALPFLFAAGFSALGSKLPRLLCDVLSIGLAALSFVLCLDMACRTQAEPWVYWFGGWHPGGGVTPGISFFVDPAGAGLAAFTSLLMVAAFGFSATYFKEVKNLFHALMLIFLGAMCG